jgi:hypothetical protein
MVPAAAAAAGAAAAGSTQQAAEAGAQPASAQAGVPTTASVPRLSPSAVRTAELAAQGAGVGCGVCKLQGNQPPAHFQVRRFMSLNHTPPQHSRVFASMPDLRSCWCWRHQ